MNFLEMCNRIYEFLDIFLAIVITFGLWVKHHFHTKKKLRKLNNKTDLLEEKFYKKMSLLVEQLENFDNVECLNERCIIETEKNYEKFTKNNNEDIKKDLLINNEQYKHINNRISDKINEELK